MKASSISIVSSLLILGVFGPWSQAETIVVDLPYFEDGAKPLEMTLIPAGTFIMGSPEDERGRYSEEWLPHAVTLTQEFYLGKHEVTQAQWEAVMGSNPSIDNPAAQSEGTLRVGDDYPVDFVSWDECQSFVEQLNSLGQGTFRLPTEAEWEYACRAGTQTRFSFGDALVCSDQGIDFCSIMDEYMWWSGNNTYSGNMDGMKPVGMKLPNSWGLHDMHGNVREWCSDWREPYPSSSQVDPQGPTSGRIRVERGGAFRLGGRTRDCRSAKRFGNTPDRGYSNIGFRLVREYP